ncbi:MAG: MarR family transcriptional regulator [Ignavibacteriaceae bacterium]|nr:MarR family transcriptional regulator [Ignavibacteriaceae bacterium]
MGKTLNKRLRQRKFKNIETEAFLNLFIASNYLRGKIETVCNDQGITHSQFNVLRILKGVHPNGYPRYDIISRMVEPAPDVTRLIDRLIKDELVERYYSEEDRRLSCSRITRKGIALLTKVNPNVDKFINEYSGVLTKTEKAKLSAVCEKLYEGELGK